MTDTQAVAAASGTYTLGGTLTVHRLGYGAMRLTGEGIWGPPKDPDNAIAVLRRTGPNRWIPCGRPDYLRQEAEMSLRRLGVETLDLFQLHRVDPHVAADEQFGLLADLQREGKVREVGLSQVSVAEI